MTAIPRRRHKRPVGGQVSEATGNYVHNAASPALPALAGRTSVTAPACPRRQSAVVNPRDPAALTGLAIWLRQNQPSREKIHAEQARIHAEMLRLSRAIDRPNFRRVGRDDLVRLIHLMDEAFFESRVLPVAKAEGLDFKFSSRMTSAAGKLVTHYPNGHKNAPRTFELILSSTLLFQTFEDVNRPVTVTGRKCNDRLEAMQRVAEHEMTHLIEMLIWNTGNCSQSRFQGIANAFFAHTDYQHDLITQRERAAAKFNIRVGDTVYFHSNGSKVVGRVNRITRRATVLVSDPKGEKFSDGGRYTRWYVPLEQLRPIS
ncbi:hypothetical protein [Allorhodopirellula heiligendammensis]|uniref:SprT-like family protein n=1 Tax=Allorhodopirellula heiligendammensis TaxID=2714739 RepID=A0A5C6C7A6_9BACT|nr:hypothetical protein [Allorhodopirellula heiligendammensis]TWU19316.1 hypothetical protein Poly21_14880 [Allorhodopirellula heiligendammensis]